MKWNMFKVYTASWSLHPKRNKHPKRKNRVKNTGYKINLDFDVIYTKHMLIIYLKIIYLLFFFLQNRILYMIHWQLNSAEFWIWEYGRVWQQHLKTDWLLHHAPLSREEFQAYIQSINKQKCTRWAFGIPVMPVLSPFNSREPQCFWAEECVESAHTKSCGKQAFMLRVSA